MIRFEQWAAIAAANAVQRPPEGRQSTWFHPAIMPSFAYRCRGNSMVPTFYDGELAYIHPQETFSDGDICAVEIDGGRTLKRVYRVPEGLRLVPDNRQYEPVTVAPEDVKIIGIAVARS